MVRATRHIALGALVALTASLPAAAALAGSSTAPPSTSPPDAAIGCEPVETVATSLPPDATAPATTAAVTGELDAWQAVDAALRATPGFAFEVETDRDRGRAVWEVKINQDDGSGVEHYVAVDTGEILRSSSTRVPRLATIPTALSLCEAIVVATVTVPGGEVVEGDLDTERGRTVWEVLVRTDRQQIELYIDAETGEVLKQEIDD